MSPSVYIDNKKKDILIIGQRPAKRLYNAALTGEAEYSINF